MYNLVHKILQRKDGKRPHNNEWDDVRWHRKGLARKCSIDTLLINLIIKILQGFTH